ncbi:MAG: AMP-binding protein [Verrucomicrobia bacterium]|nr:AMP-binding protein [Verrucomicrobiota bacterium]
MERADLIRLLRDTGCAVERAGHVFLTDSAWSESARAALAALAPADRPRASSEAGWLCIPTGGTSGGLKFARHDERTLTAAVRGFCAHFGLDRVNAVGVLPPHHVSGLMARVRCAATGGTHRDWSWKELEAGRWPDLGPGDWVLSLVPTQLQRLLGSEAGRSRLTRFRVIFLGGGPTWPALAEQAAEARLPVVLSYGMTETAAMVAAQRPEEFLAGDRSCGRAMPHATIRIGDDGLVRITGESVFRGYFPARSENREFETQDLGMLDRLGRLQVLGRRDAAIITGGKKVQPIEVEAALRACGEFADVAVLGVPDPEWGEAVVACYPGGGAAPDAGRVRATLAALAPHQRPKRLVPITPWPRNAQGKINRAALLAALR